MTTYKLTYFDLDGGRGEPIRIALHAAGIEFEDERLSFAQFSELRDSTPFNSVPVLRIDGAAVTQSNALLRYVGKQAKLYPDDDLQALYCDEVLGAFEHLSHHVGRTIGLKGAELKAAREALVDGWLGIFLRGLESLLGRGGGKYFADGRLTIADLKALVQLRHLRSGKLDHVTTDLVERVAPSLAKHQARIEAEPVVRAYYASRTQANPAVTR